MGLLYVLFPLLVTYVAAWCQKYVISESDKVRSVDFSPDGLLLALGLEDNSVKIYDAYTYSVKFTFNAPNKPYALKFNGLNTHLAVGSLHNNIVIVNLATWTTSTINSGQTEVYAIDFNSDSTVMLSCGKDNELRLWNATTFSGTALTPTLPGQGGTDFKACQFTSTNNIIIGDSTGAVRTFASPYLIANIVGSATSYGAPITSVSNRYTTVDYITSENTNKKGWASFDNSAAVYTTAPAKTVQTTSYARTLDYFMFGGAEKKVVLYNATNKNNTMVQSMTVTGNILSSDFTNDGKYLVAGCDDKLAVIYTQYCMQCDTGYFFNSTTKLCDVCSAYLEGCGACFSSAVCAICIQGYYQTSAKICAICNTAMIGCSVCNSSTYCTTPLPGYYVTTGNVPATCQSAIPGCLICNSSAICRECHNEYYLNTGTNRCTACSTLTNCLKCYNASYCTQCEAGYYPNTAVANTATCSRCATNCLDCQSPTVCFQCVLGYYTTGGTCQACSANCLACNNTNYCTDCATNTYNSAGTCTSCTAPCLSCITAATTCLSCYPGYYFDGNVSCVTCPTGCITCTSASVCLTCIQGYYYNSTSTSCIKCNNTYPNCQSCNFTNCTHCLTSFYYDSTANQCKSCANQMHACTLCSSSTICLFCAPGHYLSALTGNNSCQPCASGCSTCETAANCTSCVPGFYFDSSTFTCIKCTSRCTSCTSATFCQSCIIGYYLQNATAGTCQACNATMPYCLSCLYDSNNTLQCTQCGVGFYLNSGACSRCGSNCVTCSAASTCLSCQLGFYFNGTDSTCRTCSSTCSECSASGVCQSCQVGYYLNGSSCLACTSIGCLTCRADLKCLSCISGYFLNSTSLGCQTCASSMPNCLQCQSSTTCNQCSYGYALTTSGANTTCTTCSTLTGCFHCSSLSVCLGCQSGYWLNGNSCSACPEGCRVCANSSSCMTCGTSYFSGDVLGGANVGTCLRCQFYLEGCELCANNTDCGNCQAGYYLTTVSNHTVCKLCQINIPYCSMCNTSTICSSCKGGYYLASTNQSCIQCSTTFTACRLCDRLGTACTDCQSSYYLSGSNCLLCSSTLPGCQICNGSSSCVECSSGYYLNNGTCHLCSANMPGCIFCNSSNVCLQCEAGYYLNATNYTCMPCAVVGCEVCVQASPTSCVTCNSMYYKSSATACTLCRTPLPGCLTCTSSSTCSKCDVGYYQNSPGSTPQCLLCSNSLQGCSICSSSTTCLQCKSMYFLNTSSQCQVCSVPLTGCTFCTNSTVCLSCGSGYFKNSSSLCQSCTDLTGCLVCKDGSTCLFCDTGYYFSAFSCQSCSVITGCYSCISATVCSSCIGGYTLNSNNLCDVAQVQAASKVTDIMMKTFYVNATTLKHFLYVKGSKFSKDVKLNWQTNASLYIYSDNGTKINLVIKDVQWATDNDYTLIFFTDNPLDLSSKTKKMPFARRLQSLDLSDSKTGIELSDQAIQQLLPGYQHSGSLVLDYKLDDPQFYASYTKEYKSQFPFFAISAAIVGLLFLKFGIKSLVTVPKSTNLGNIIPHILAFKVGALLLFPTYFEYINYCSGFMYADFPWLNRFFGEKLSDPRDKKPEAYSIFYDNMNLASMYLLAISIFIVLALITVLIGKSLPKYEYKMYSFLSFLYNFFAFGLFFAGCASFQGAIINPISSLTVNAAFYIIGILVYFAMVCECIYKLSKDKSQYFWKLRILIKATLLSLSHYSPIYLLASTVVIDLVLVIVEFQLNPYSKTYCKSWVFSNVTCNLALILLVFLPIIELTMVMVSAALFLVIVAETFMHYQETRENLMVTRLEMTENVKDDDRNMWELNFTDKQMKKGQTSQSFYKQTKGNMTSSKDPQNMQTMYPKQDGNKKESDLEETQVFGGKYKRQRNYKKVREEAKAKRIQIEDINNKSNPNNQSRESNGENNLTFMMEEI